MANQPSIIPSAWAANNSTTETIPATTSESGKASWDQGFPVETSLPLSEGGIPPKYGDFNGILNVLSQFCLFAQAGGQFTWNSTLSYSVGSIVVGSDGSIYRAMQATTNVNPVGDTSGKWERIVSQSDITALEADIQTAMSDASNAVSNASAAQSAVTTLDANVVKLSGGQSVGGIKTFTSNPRISSNTPFIDFIEGDITKGTAPTGSDTGYQGISFGDKNRVVMGMIAQYYVSTRDNYMMLRANNASSASATGSTDVYVGYGATSGAHVRPNGNGTVVLGLASYRWGQIYSSNSTISTSDARLKTSIDIIPDDVLDAWADVNWSQFQMNDAVEVKGNNARLHTGLIAQRIDEAFKAHGLDASRYGLFCYDEWEAEEERQDDKGNVIQEARPAGDMYSLRYEEALCMEAAYQRRRADRAEARISALERRLDEMEAVLASLISPVGDETYAEPEQEQDAEQEGEE